MFVKILLAIILVEAITELVVKSKIFRSVRFCIKKRFPIFFRGLIECGYCFSFWVSLIVILLFQIKLMCNGLAGFVVALFIIHRCASHLHDLTHVVVKHERTV